jgi:hypothetical protein
MDMSGLVGSLLGGNHNMGSTGNTLGVVLDLLSDSGQQNHASSLESIAGNLLGGSGQQGGMDVTDLVGSLLGGGSSPSVPSYQSSAPAPQQHTQPPPQQHTKPDMGSMQDAIGNLAVGNPKKKKPGFNKQ